MKPVSNISRVAGGAMLGIFGINLYVGLYDTNLAQISPMHANFNWVITGIDFIAALVLLLKVRKASLKILAGILWPIIYVGSLFVDVETRLCLGAAASTCFPTVSDSYNYLILGSRAEEWVLYPYTIRLAIVTAIAVLILTSISLVLARQEIKRKAIVRI